MVKFSQSTENLQCKYPSLSLAVLLTPDTQMVRYALTLISRSAPQTCLIAFLVRLFGILLLSVLGIAASFAGKAYGQIGQGLPLAASGLAVIMGLNLLEIIELQLPSFFNNFDPRAAAANFPSSVQAYLAGLTFALAASPCSTPVLATLLGYVAASKMCR